MHGGKMNRRDISNFVDLRKELKETEEESFSFFTDDVTEDLKYK